MKAHCINCAISIIGFYCYKICPTRIIHCERITGTQIGFKFFRPVTVVIVHHLHVGDNRPRIILHISRTGFSLAGYPPVRRMSVRARIEITLKFFTFNASQNFYKLINQNRQIFLNRYRKSSFRGVNKDFVSSIRDFCR